MALGDSAIPARLVRTTWLLTASDRLDLSTDLLAIRRISRTEAETLRETARKRNVFARHSWENSFYLKRIEGLADATVIEVFRTGELDVILPDARSAADTLERVAVVSSALGLRRRRTQQLLGISAHRRYGFDVAMSAGFEYLRSTARPETAPRGIPIDAAFVRRFNRCGFPNLVRSIIKAQDIGRRLERAVGWLFESRQEPSSEAAAVKTTIALETLLIASESESLRNTLGERASFLLSNDPPTRARIAKTVKAFYDRRSRIVHGGRKSQPHTPGVIDGVDRIVLLLLVTLAQYASNGSSFDEVLQEIERRKWGGMPPRKSTPFPMSHLTRALQLMDDRQAKKSAT